MSNITPTSKAFTAAHVTAVKMPFTTEQAITRARRIIAGGEKLTSAAEAVSTARRAGPAAYDAAHALKEAELLNYRYSTLPEGLGPLLEALIEAASKSPQDSQP
jgi:hypothetical protein